MNQQGTGRDGANKVGEHAISLNCSTEQTCENVRVTRSNLPQGPVEFSIHQKALSHLQRPFARLTLVVLPMRALLATSCRPATTSYTARTLQRLASASRKLDQRSFIGQVYEGHYRCAAILARNFHGPIGQGNLAVWAAEDSTITRQNSLRGKTRRRLYGNEGLVLRGRGTGRIQH